MWGEGDSSGDPPITHLKELEEALSSATDRKSNRHSVTETDRTVRGSGVFLLVVKRVGLVA